MIALLVLFVGMCTYVSAKIDGSQLASGEIYEAGDGVYSVRLGKIEYTVWHNEPVAWHEAYDFCDKYNMSLVVLNTREKIVKLQMFLVKQNFVQSQINDASTPYVYWIGGNDLEKRNEWKWIPTNKPFTYTHWLIGEPTYSADQRCVEMGDKSLGRWSNSPCSTKRFFICERNMKTIRQKSEL